MASLQDTQFTIDGKMDHSSQYIKVDIKSREPIGNMKIMLLRHRGNKTRKKPSALEQIEGGYAQKK
jgi:hypothetical protein